MNQYKHITLLEREMILFYLAKEYSITKIAFLLDRNKSTISREINRNTINGRYIPVVAQQTYHKRRTLCKAPKKLRSKKLYKIVKELFLNHQWSPEQIANRLKLEQTEYSISYTTIYRAIYNGDFDEANISRGNRGAIRKLRHRGKSRHTKSYEERRGKIRISNLITERPKEADDRKRIGDWEADTVAGIKGKACFLTLVDRNSRFLICKRVSKKASIDVKEAIIDCLKNEPLKSITPDRGKEFSKHFEVSAVLGVEFYFPFPHHPWQRGTNENTNGLLREYFPKSKDITDLQDKYIAEKVDELNRRPRKCLNWKTPYEVYYSKTLHLT